jgi:DNA-binding PadR family transcriptional regulator
MRKEKLATFQEKFTQELRRGALILAVLSQLKEARYGYALIDQLAKQGLDIEQGTLYPLLRRLGEQGLLQSEWNVEGSHPRRYYVISPMGRDLLLMLINDWQQLNVVMGGLLSENEGDSNGSY